MSSWWNVKLMICQVDEWRVDKMSSWWNVKLMKCKVDQMWSRQNVMLTKCWVDEMPSRWNVKLTKCQVDKMFLHQSHSRLLGLKRRQMLQPWSHSYKDFFVIDRNKLDRFSLIFFCCPVSYLPLRQVPFHVEHLTSPQTEGTLLSLHTIIKLV